MLVWKSYYAIRHQLSARRDHVLGGVLCTTWGKPPKLNRQHHLGYAGQVQRYIADDPFPAHVIGGDTREYLDDSLAVVGERRIGGQYHSPIVWRDAGGPGRVLSAKLLRDPLDRACVPRNNDGFHVCSPLLCVTAASAGAKSNIGLAA